MARFEDHEYETPVAVYKTKLGEFKVQYNGVDTLYASMVGDSLLFNRINYTRCGLNLARKDSNWQIEPRYSSISRNWKEPELTFEQKKRLTEAVFNAILPFIEEKQAVAGA